MANEPVRTGIVGYGFVSKTFHVPMILATDGMELVAVSSSRPEQVRADLPGVEGVGSADELIARDDLDLIVIASPNQTHRPLAEATLCAGKHVLVDKPFVLSLEEARSILRIADEHGKSVSVFQNRRWDSDFLGIRRVIEEGYIGRVVELASRMIRFVSVPNRNWRETSGDGSGLWFDLAPHLVDQAVQLFGLPEAVTAEIATLRSGAKTDDWFEAILRYPGLRVVLGGSLVAKGGVPRFLVHGDAGSVLKQEADVQEDRFKEGMAPDADGVGGDDDPLTVFHGDGRQETLSSPMGSQITFYRDLARAIRGQGPNPVSPRDALAVMAVIDAAQRSATEGRMTKLALTEDEFSQWQ
ncbi:oxidoreductase [Gluconacetobacter tumulicola]|uniref:Oxidoreductase n=2 Tax=Gluconacetobacter tumulicola TaxID=1017177 RepID=A0A7W4JFZ3_9PROT|nr:oxidoreductase [Gluconacetobacter tumulicola]